MKFGRLIEVERRFNSDGKELEPYFYIGDYQVSIDSAIAALKNLEKAIQWTAEKTTHKRAKATSHLDHLKTKKF